MGPAVAEVLGKLVKVLHSMHHDLRDIKVVIKDHWGSEGDDELTDGYMSWEEALEMSEAAEELAGLSEDAADYCAFWMGKYGEEYEEGGVARGKDGEKGGNEEVGGSGSERMEVDVEVAGSL